MKIKNNELTMQKNENQNESKQNINFVLTDIPGLYGKIGQDKILKLINIYRSIMSSERESLGQTNLIKAYINTEKHSPIYTKQHPISHR